MNIVLTGASGLFGSSLAALARRRGIDCLPLARQGLLSMATRLPVDLTADTVLVHAAASTDVEANERDPATCYRDNLLLTEQLARRAARAGCRVVFISSTGVYGQGQAEPHDEFSATRPTTHHHRSKLLAERAVLRHCPDALVLRTGWLFGGGAEHPKNFVARRIAEARAAGSGALHSNPRQQGNPTAADDLAERLLMLLQGDAGGVFNAVNTGHASRLDYVREIVRLCGLPAIVEAADPASFQRVARVSDNEMAVNLKSSLLGLPPMPHWHDSLARCVATLLA